MHKMHRANQDNYYIDEKIETYLKILMKRNIFYSKINSNECRKLQGFPSDWKYVVSDTQLYRQFGNAVL